MKTNKITPLVTFSDIRGNHGTTYQNISEHEII